MINIRLLILLLVICILFTGYIFYNIFKRKLSLQYSLMWFSYILVMIVLLISKGVVSYVAKFFGFEVTSNMIFFFGFLALIIISFTLTKFLSMQKEKMTELVQEVAILKKELKDHHEKH